MFEKALISTVLLGLIVMSPFYVAYWIYNKLGFGPKEEWTLWFAWYPVLTKKEVKSDTFEWFEDEMVWLEIIERRQSRYSYGIEYRERDGTYDY